jgi:hypothetical protein
MKQTSIDWMREEIKKALPMTITPVLDRITEQAKEMHKKDIEIAHLMGLITSIEMEATKQAEQYYAETYGK